MIAAHLDNLLFLLLIAVALLFQFLAKAAGKTSRDQMKRITPQTPEPIPRAPSESDEDRIRKLLEALGQPPGSRPPPPVLPRTDIPPRPLAPVPPPMSPLSQLRREKSRKREIKGIPPPQPLTSAAKTVPTFEVHEGSSPIEQAPTVKTATRAIARIEEARIEIVTLLASKSGLRDAIILREILGPPRGFRTIDQTL
jgi:hypothetical protein